MTTARRFFGSIRRAIGLRRASPDGHNDLAALQARCRGAPDLPGPHLDLARLFMQCSRYFEAHACYRTARALGATAAPELEAAATMAPPLDTLIEHERLTRIAARVKQLLPERHGSVLDIGGGNGALAQALPACDYYLAEPGTNGISGREAKGYQRQFTVVTCCHVLEHIPEVQKAAFLEEIVALASEHVVLLGPSAGDAKPPAVDEVFLRIMNAQWAAEHLACGWPRVAELQEFARARGWRCRVTPNGNMATTYWLVLAQHFASMANRYDDFVSALKFYHQSLASGGSSPPAPNDYLIELSKPR